MNTCDTCKHWGGEDWGEIKDLRECTHPKVNGLSDSGEEAPKDALVQCGMDAGYPTNCTGPKFGCIHHE